MKHLGDITKINECEGQLTMLEVFGQDLWCGRMSQAPLVQTKAKTSEEFTIAVTKVRFKDDN